MRDFFAHTYDLLLKGAAGVAGFLHGMGDSQCRATVFLVALMAADYLSGVAAAVLGKSAKSAHGKLSSDAGAKGLLKKVGILLAVGLAYVVDWFINEGNAMFLTAIIWFYISNEALSLAENLTRLGVPIPRRFRNALEKLATETGEDAQAAGPALVGNKGTKPARDLGTDADGRPKNIQTKNAARQPDGAQIQNG